MNIIEYVNKYDRKHRTSHIDLTEQCHDAIAINGGCRTKKGEICKSFSAQMNNAKRLLTKYLGLTGKTDRYNHLCHMCNSNTPNGGMCANPKHLYFGSASENSLDKPENVRIKGGNMTCRDNVKKSIKNGNHMNQQKKTCVICGFESNPGVITRFHNDNCKYKK